MATRCPLLHLERSLGDPPAVGTLAVPAWAPPRPRCPTSPPSSSAVWFIWFNLVALAPPFRQRSRPLPPYPARSAISLSFLQAFRCRCGWAEGRLIFTSPVPACPQDQATFCGHRRVGWRSIGCATIQRHQNQDHGKYARELWQILSVAEKHLKNGLPLTRLLRSLAFARPRCLLTLPYAFA